jgi:hypothetical protein
MIGMLGLHAMDRTPAPTLETISPPNKRVYSRHPVMRDINGTLYKLGLIDTGIISELVNNHYDERNSLVKLMISEPILPCISIWSILEIRERIDIYDTFLELFSLVPFLLIESPYHILQDEIKNYPDPTKVDPVATAFSMFAEDPNTKVIPWMTRLFSQPKVKEAETMWRGPWKDESLEAMLSLRENFRPKGKRYAAEDASRFIEIGVPQYIIGQAPDWARSLLNDGISISHDAFPSVKMSFYTVFYRFYAENRKPEKQDVFDIMIGNVAPYLDIVITEKYQCEIYRKVKNRDPFLKDLQIEDINILRR